MARRFFLFLILFILGSSFYSAFNQVNSRRLPSWLSSAEPPAAVHEINAESVARFAETGEQSESASESSHLTELDTVFKDCDKASKACVSYKLQLRVAKASYMYAADSAELLSAEPVSGDSSDKMNTLAVQFRQPDGKSFVAHVTKADFKEAINENWYELYKLAGVGRVMLNRKYGRLLIGAELVAADESDRTQVMLEYNFDGRLLRAFNAGNCAGGPQLNPSETVLLACGGTLHFEQDTFKAFEQPRTAYVSFLNDTAYAVVVDDQYYSSVFGNSQIRALGGDTLFSFNFAGYLPGGLYHAAAGYAGRSRAQVYFNPDYGEVILFYADRPRSPRHFSLEEFRKVKESPAEANDAITLALDEGRNITFYFDERRDICGYAGAAQQYF